MSGYTICDAIFLIALIAGDFTAYRHARNEARFAIRQFHNNFEISLLQAGNRTAFFKYVNKCLGKSAKSSIVIMNETELHNGRDAADLLNM